MRRIPRLATVFALVGLATLAAGAANAQDMTLGHERYTELSQHCPQEILRLGTPHVAMTNLARMGRTTYLDVLSRCRPAPRQGMADIKVDIPVAPAPAPKVQVVPPPVVQTPPPRQRYVTPPQASEPEPRITGCPHENPVYVEAALANWQGPAVLRVYVGQEKGRPLNADKPIKGYYNPKLGLICVPRDVFQAAWVQICIGKPLPGGKNSWLIQDRWMVTARNNLARGDIVNPGQPMQFVYHGKQVPRHMTQQAPRQYNMPPRFSRPAWHPRHQVRRFHYRPPFHHRRPMHARQQQSPFMPMMNSVLKSIMQGR